MSKKEVIINKTVIIALSFFMFLSGLGLILAGKRTRKKQWTIEGLLYIVLSWVFMSFGLVSIYMILWLVSIIRTVLISKEYCMRLNVIKESSEILQEKKIEQYEKRQQDIYRELVGENTDEIEYKEVRTEQNIIPQVDINTCEESELAAVPGIGFIISKRIMDIRREKIFSSVDEFYRRLGIDEEKQKLMSQYLTCSKQIAYEKETEKQETGDGSGRSIGRKIDI